jgi:hypothetical protein
LTRIAPVAIAVSIGSMAARGFAGGSAPITLPPATPPWPPWFIQLNLSPTVSPIFSWFAVLSGGFGLVAGLVALRQGWRPSPRRLMAGSAIAVVILTVVPPVASGAQSICDESRTDSVGQRPSKRNSKSIPRRSGIEIWPTRHPDRGCRFQTSRGLARPHCFLAESVERARLPDNRPSARSTGSFRYHKSTASSSIVVGQSLDAVPPNGRRS